MRIILIICISLLTLSFIIASAALIMWRYNYKILEAKRVLFSALAFLLAGIIIFAFVLSKGGVSLNGGSTSSECVNDMSQYVRLLGTPKKKE